VYRNSLLLDERANHLDVMGPVLEDVAAWNDEITTSQLRERFR
jgi:hypothetical protein